jgi:hypothetical protein
LLDLGGKPTFRGQVLQNIAVSAPLESTAWFFEPSKSGERLLKQQFHDPKHFSG